MLLVISFSCLYPLSKIMFLFVKSKWNMIVQVSVDLCSPECDCGWQWMTFRQPVRQSTTGLFRNTPTRTIIFHSLMKAIIDIFSTWRAQSNRSLFCWRSSLDCHQPTQNKRYKISLWVPVNSWARSSLNRSLSGILKSSLFPASAISGHGLTRISPWAFMWAKSAVSPSAVYIPSDRYGSIYRKMLPKSWYTPL